MAPSPVRAGCGACESAYQAMAANVVATRTWIHEYIPWEPSGLKITMIQVENAPIAATAGRD